MYNTYFNFSESPFENNLDQRFLFASDDHREVLAALSYFIKTKKAFAIVCGDVGTGKSMLINCFLNRLPENIQPIIISNPGVTSLELLSYIAKTLRIQVTGKEGVLELTDKVKDFLIRAKGVHKQFVLIIDEAHLLADQALEEIRLLSNIETQDQKLLQILLVGQYELSYKLDRPEMRHLRQRININRFLSPLNSFETSQYIDHRLKQVGSSFASVFEDDCKVAIFKMTEGVPRRINQLCDNALLICMSEMREKVDRKILKKAEEALLTDRIFTPRFFKSKNVVLRGKFLRPALIATVCAVFFISGIMLSQTFLHKKVQDSPLKVSPKPLTLPDVKAEPLSKTNRDSKKELTSGLSKELISNLPENHGERQTTQPAASDGGGSGLSPQIPTNLKEESGSPTLGLESAAGKANDGLPGPSLSGNTSLGNPAHPEELAKAEAARSPVGQRETTGPSGEILKSLPAGRVAKKGETLSSIAAENYRGNESFGLEAIIMDNHEISNKNLIFPGQVVYLPELNPGDHTLRLRDHIFYSFYGRYQSKESLNKEISELEKKKVRYKIIDIKNSGGPNSYRIVLGGYENIEDLRRDLAIGKSKPQ